MISQKRAREIYDYAQKHGDDAALQKFQINIESLNRYKRVARQPEFQQELGEWKKVNWRELSKLAKDHSKIKERLCPSQTEAFASVPESCVVMLLGDLHIGAPGVDYQFLEDLTDFIKKEQVYFILAGDELDTFFSGFYSALPVQEQVLSPDEQIFFLESWLEEIGEYLLCSCWGNHTHERIEKLTGLKFYDRLKARFAPYFGGIGKLNLTVGKVEYKVILTHKPPGKSVFNPLHGAFNLARRIVDGDVFIGAHYHSTAYGEWEIRGQDRIAVQTGTIKYSDDFSERHFRFGKTNIMIPALHFDGTRKHIVPFKSVFDAVRFRS